MQLSRLDPEKKSFLWRWGLVGIIIRILIMPFAAHGDLFAEYDRASRAFQSFSFASLGPSRIVDVLHGAYFWLMSYLAPQAPAIFKAVRFSVFASDAELTSKWLTIVGYPGIFRVLFLLKLPYLLMDIAAALVLVSLFDSWLPTRRAFLFWVFNPVLIFTSYMFGRYDIAVVLLVLLSLAAAKKGSLYVSVLLIAAATVVRISPIILLPVFVLTLSEKPAQRLRLAFVGATPIMLATVMGSGGGSAGMGLMPDARQLHSSYPLMMSIKLFLMDRFYFFVFFYAIALILLYLFPRVGYQGLIKGCATIMLIFFATSFFHPHYLTWLMPFSALFVADPRFLKSQVIQFGGWFGYTFQWGGSLAGYLFAPISPAFFWALPSFYDLAQRVASAEVIVGLSRSLLSAAAAVMIYLIWKEERFESVQL